MFVPDVQMIAALSLLCTHLALRAVASIVDGCVQPDPSEPFQTCNMVDYAFYMPDVNKSIHLLDYQAQLNWEYFADTFYDTSNPHGWQQTENCANAMRGFQCALAFNTCDENGAPQAICSSTCDAFADYCYDAGSAVPLISHNFTQPSPTNITEWTYLPCLKSNSG
tara:strand:- start:1290 stop:1787 length:498 start_codon:yes stop_codon:yes gene_type:complete